MHRFRSYLQYAGSMKRNIAADCYDYCFETGPGTVLAGLWKASGSTIPCIAAGTLQAIAAFSL